MNRYLKKIIFGILSIFLLSIIVFFMARLSPGDPVVAYYGDRAEKMSEEEKEITRERLGLNEPIIVQYGIWLKNAIGGDFGISYKYKQSVGEVISGRALNTLVLGGVSFLLSFLLSLLLGMYCAMRENKLSDKIIRQFGTISSTIPSFWLSLVFILIFSVFLSLLPSSGAYALGKASDIGSRLRHMILPVSVLVVSHLWYYAFMVRNKFLEETKKAYVMAAFSKGLSRKQVFWRHILPNILPSYISMMAISVPHILGGTYVVEAVFSYPGLGSLSFESAKYHDYNMLMCLCLITGIAVIVSGIIGEIISEKIDPRMRSPKAVLEEVADNG